MSAVESPFNLIKLEENIMTILTDNEELILIKSDCPPASTYSPPRVRSSVWRYIYDKVFVWELLKAKPDYKYLNSLYKSVTTGRRNREGVSWMAYRFDEKPYLPGIAVQVDTNGDCRKELFEPIAAFKTRQERDEVLSLFSCFERTYWEEKPMRIWLDDTRNAPMFYNCAVKTAQEAIDAIQNGGVTHISLDHDLGQDKTGYDVAKYIEQHAYNGGYRFAVQVHTQNPVGRENMMKAIKNAYRFWSQQGKSIPQDSWTTGLG